MLRRGAAMAVEFEIMQHARMTFARSPPQGHRRARVSGNGFEDMLTLPCNHAFKGPIYISKRTRLALNKTETPAARNT